MAVRLPALGELRAVPGVRIGTACAGIKQSTRDDVVVMALAEGTRVAAVFTRSSFKAAPVQLCERHLANGAIRALLINSGNANAATGDAGIADAMRCCTWVGSALAIDPQSVLPFSTGVIGSRLPLDKLEGGIADAAGRLGEAWEPASRAIMTTDTGPKALSTTCVVDGKSITVTGCAKGAGMIKPNMATMLAYVATDAGVAQPLLDRLVREVNEASFNRISIDGDTSTNDSFVLIATGAAGVEIDSAQHRGYSALKKAVREVAIDLAQRIVRDGEGATKFVTVTVGGGKSKAECLSVAYTIAESPLVKTALFASDPNWGRICMAIGRSGIKDLDTGAVSLHIGGVCVAKDGMIAPTYTEEQGAAAMAADEIVVKVDLGRGKSVETVWTCDFSYDYVKINAEYRT